jgi:solute carrier family 66 (lysosomal lysine-arginine transporter), member 1
VVYSPQIYENYVRQSGEGLSLLFVAIWLLGDLSNLVGAILGGLLPTVIILASYVSFINSRLMPHSNIIPVLGVRYYIARPSILLPMEA